MGGADYRRRLPAGRRWSFLRLLPALLAGRDDRGWSDAQQESEQGARGRQQKNRRTMDDDVSPNADPQDGVKGPNVEPVESQIVFTSPGHGTTRLRGGSMSGYLRAGAPQIVCARQIACAVPTRTSNQRASTPPIETAP